MTSTNADRTRPENGHSSLMVRGAALLTVAFLIAACNGTAATPTPPAATATPATTPGASGSPAASASPTFATTPGDVTLVAYSTPKAAYDAIIPLFQGTPAGAGVNFEESYGASGDQSRAVAAGLPADVVAFSLSPDIDRLVTAGLVASDWNSGTYKGMVTDSVVVFVVRKGNPKNIKTWDDLTQDGLGVIEANPFTSGGARWNVMAAWGAEIKSGKTEAEATQYLSDLFANVLVQDDSARASMQTFISGQGDVMLAYENEAIAAQQGGQDIDYVIPDQTILIENPVAVATGGDATAKAADFVSYLTTNDAQEAYASKGYRPVVPSVMTEHAAQFPNPSGLFTIDDPALGGWSAVNTKFFDKTNGVVAKIELGLGIQP